MTSCSIEWDDSALPAWGTAKDARTIVVVESSGAWGRDAVKEAGLRGPKGATLYVVRSPGRHSETPDSRQVFVSGGFGDEPWLVAGILSAADISDFLSGDVADAEHQHRFGMTARTEPVLLVCTNGKRDACCAVRGRPVALAGDAAVPGSVWEVSHIGGHKFAPTGIHLPSGQTFGRLTEADGRVLATASMADSLSTGLFSMTKHRGRIDLSSASRVAETWWRERHPDLTLVPLRLGPERKTAEGIEVELPDGARLLVTSHRGPDLRDSCAKLPKKSQFFEAHLLS